MIPIIFTNKQFLISVAQIVNIKNYETEPVVESIITSIIVRLEV